MKICHCLGQQDLELCYSHAHANAVARPDCKCCHVTPAKLAVERLLAESVAIREGMVRLKKSLAKNGQQW